ncbi:MAG TPA: hypothetical protein VGP72_18740 [Planctomycetota bacterium]
MADLLHRLVRDKHICRCSAQAVALYLFLVTVADAEGLSYYSDGSLTRLLPLDETAVARARQARNSLGGGEVGSWIFECNCIGNSQ